uniref:Protein kinase domain-containing protein n=1 Tax=Eutreptiella gymnastica TaxID=73025 RepID=A0A7S1IX27_9EUGL|mmetsp:Transcript_48806/g.86954  ORF Transcript_48806/g.86954 Transcript_48806/m.86954 type:complete len:421 (+) Transcript_48806:178-1440(+)
MSNTAFLDKHVPSVHVPDAFVLKEPLGKGKYAEVFKVQRKSDQKFFALKQIGKSKLLLDSDFDFRQLAHEIIISKHLEHPGCVKCHEVFQDNTNVYLLLELVDGGDLLSIIKDRRDDLTESAIIHISTQILETLKYLHHDQGIAHRDLKPENLLCTGGDLEQVQVKFTDFGYAKFFARMEDISPSLVNKLQSPGLLSRTTSGLASPGGVPQSPSVVLNTPKGTMRYLAPEIIQHYIKHGQKPRYTTRPEIQKVDIYAIGVVVYMMLCGSFPYKGETGVQINDSMQKKKKLCFRAGVSKAAKNFCRSLTSKNPAERPLAIQALKYEWLTPPTPSGSPFIRTGERTFEDALEELELELEELEDLRQLDSDEDRDLAEEAHVADGGADADGVEVIPRRALPTGLQLNVPKRNHKGKKPRKPTA